MCSEQDSIAQEDSVPLFVEALIPNSCLQGPPKTPQEGGGSLPSIHTYVKCHHALGNDLGFTIQNERKNY